VQALRTPVFAAPTIKRPLVDTLSFGSRVAVAEEGLWHDGAELARLADGRYVPAQHLAPGDHVEPDWPATAERFVGVPYVWGGRSSLGLDCSALLQLALDAAGIACPRDSDQQQAALGQDLGGEPGAKLGSVHDAMQRPGPGSLPLRRGDLVFLPRHIGIMLDSARLLHCNAHHMAVAVEPLQRALARIAANQDLKVAAIKRLSG
jgi:cell wall-associated NlpC family hydrolase